MPRPLAIVTQLFALCCTAAAQSAAPAVEQNKDIRIPRIATKPKLEEFLNGHSRSDMLRIDDFRQRNPGDGIPLSLKTSAWIGWDDKNFYVVFDCKEPPSQIRARLGKREDIFSDDFVGIFFDTYHDRQRAYEFFVNPLGVQADGITVESRDDDFSFDTLWYSAGRITPDGFVTMMTIPFKSLRFTAKDAQLWGFGVGRWIPTRNENGFWPFVSNRLNSFSPQLANLTGLESISPGRNIQLIPYAALGHAHFLDNPGADGSVPAFRSTNDERAGLDAKMILHDSLTLDVALRPDFSQVESDDPQVTVNQRYEVQFNEKRPFFIENNGFFQTPENLFFSRRIIDPHYGARLTGKLGRWNMGFLTIDDRAPGIEAGPADENYGEDAIVGVGRIQREFGSQSNVGALFTDREFAGSFNRVGALDTRLHLHKTWYLAAQGMASQTQDTAHHRYGGDAWNVSLNSGTRHYYYNLNYIDRSEGFNTDLGFVNRVDIRQIQQYYQYKFRPKSGFLISYGPSLNLIGDLDHRNVQQDWQVRPGFQMEMARSTYLNVNRAELFERFNGINFRRVDHSFGGHSEYFKFLTLDGGYSWGTRINYSTPSGVTAFLGQGNEANANLTIRPSSRVKIDEIYDLTRLRTMGPHPEGVFVNHLLRSRLNYQHNRQLSLRVIIDYNALLNNPALFDADKQKRVTGDILLTWLLNPGTAVYIGYTDTLENQALLNGIPNTVIRTNLPSVTTQRQFFAKLSYLFRF
ncbi:MAG TPA: DUF5916 domain-containing protein [Bryobacteraceae bacterium]|nr:DUF5916 domain-containing protein [Bryobacteraceae bacterium]